MFQKEIGHAAHGECGGWEKGARENLLHSICGICNHSGPQA